jgi:hypothetical protein
MNNKTMEDELIKHLAELNHKYHDVLDENDRLKELSKNIINLLNNDFELYTPTGKEYMRRMIYDVIPELNPN